MSGRTPRVEDAYTYVLRVSPEDFDDVDPTHPQGLTQEAYDRLYEAITDAGFAVVFGPERLAD